MSNKDNLPRYIREVPWYKEGQEEEVKDHSYSIAGKGFTDNTFDSKRDKWEGYEIEYKEEEVLKGIDIKESEIDLEEDDTDYELEKQELGLTELKKDDNKQGVEEKMVRDRQDVPDYIRNLNEHYNDNEWDGASGSGASTGATTGSTTSPTT